MAIYRDINEYTKEKIRRMQEMRDAVEKEYASIMGNALNKSYGTDNRVEIEKKPKEVTVRVDGDKQGSKVVDLKPHFSRGPKVRYGKTTGSWYQIVPIRRYTPQKENKSTNMSSRLYRDLLNTPLSNRFNETVSNYLYDNTSGGSMIEELNYRPRSKNITRMKNEKGRGSRYIAFRTVSDRSHPASWVLNRSKAVEEENLTQEIKDVIKQVKNQGR